MSMSINLTVLILTCDEEANLPQVLASVTGWASAVFVLDSGSTDRTVEIAKTQGAKVFTHAFENYASQRNYALKKLPIETEWVMFLDADEWLPEELKQEISGVFVASPEENGFLIARKFIWMGKWIRRGYYPTWILRLFRHGKGICGDRIVNEHVTVEGKTGYLKHPFIHEDRKGISAWIEKHNRYASMEAEVLLNREGELRGRLFGTPPERTQWIRFHVWYRLPPLVRPFIYFFYRFVLRGGFLDGRPGFAFHFLQALWFQFLVDLMYLEQKALRKRAS
jgi:glycosyltransferase involved in cell wall biosynthesis